jgi:hypothetical protein
MTETGTVSAPSPFDSDPATGPVQPPQPPSMPRWVKFSLVFLAVLVAVLVVGLVTGGHGPSRHGGSGTFRSAELGNVWTQ